MLILVQRILVYYLMRKSLSQKLKITGFIIVTEKEFISMLEMLEKLTLIILSKETILEIITKRA